MEMNKKEKRRLVLHLGKVDVLVIGGGIIGSAILHKLSQLNLTSAMVEKQEDLCEGSSKANSAIVHTGFDAPVGSVEAACLRASRELWPEIVANHRLAYEKRGAVMIAFNEKEKKTIEKKYLANAAANGVEVEWISREEILANNSAVNSACIGGLLISGESIVDPFRAVYAFGEIAVLNGANVHLGAGVVGIEKLTDGFEVALENGSSVTASYIINAAGLYADQIATMIGDHSFKILPRKGQFIVSKSTVGINNIILPVPNEKSKGKLVTPAVFGGYLFGPTAEDQDDKEDRSITAEGIEEIWRECEQLLPASRSYVTVRQYAGVRSVNPDGDYIIRPSVQSERFIHAAGIRSTGLSAAPGIAEAVLDQLKAVGMTLEKKSGFTEKLPESFGAEEEEHIVCLCKGVTHKEISETLNRPLAPKTLDGVKRRTGAMLGGCQGSCCIPKIISMLKKKHAIAELPLKGRQGSLIALKGD